MTGASTRDGDERPSTRRTALLSRARPADAVPLLAVPVALVAVFLLPESTRRALAFAYADPTLPTAFTAHYVHLEVDHLLANLAAYGLLAGVGYLLATTSRQRRFYFVAFATFCLAFPVALSALNLAVPRDAVGFGFSGINMAFAGLLPLLLARFAHEHLTALDADVPVSHRSGSAPIRSLPAVFLVLVGWMASLALPTATTLAGVVGPAVALCGLAVGVWTLRSAGATPSAARVWLRRVVDAGRDGDLFAAGTVLVVAYPAVGFPSDPTAGGGVVNLYVHLLGFCLAFIGPYALLVAGAFDR